MTTEGTIDQRDQPRDAPSRVRLAFFLVPIGMVFTGAQVARAIWPTLLAEAPWTLLVLSSNTTRMLLVEPLVPTVVFLVLAIGRVALLAPLYYYFGRSYGDPALRWAEVKLGPTSRIVPTSERLFRRFSHALVAWSPHLFVSVMAGATGMRARAFFPIAMAGTIVKVTVVYFLGDVFAVPLREFADFVGRYQWYLTPLTFSIVAIQLWLRRKRNAIPIETIDEFEHELEVDDDVELDERSTAGVAVEPAPASAEREDSDPVP